MDREAGEEGKVDLLLVGVGMKKTKKIILKARIAAETFFYRRIVAPLLSISCIGNNTISGKADAGVSIDCIYQEQPKGMYLFGNFVDGMLRRLPAVKATVKKKEVIIKILQNEVANNHHLNITSKILDLASGPARYMVDFIEQRGSDCAGVEVLCLDNEQTSINFGKVIGKDKPMRFVKADIFKLGTLKRFSNKIGWKPNIILCTGFFELSEDAYVRKLLKEIFDFMAIGGLLVFTSQADNPSKKLMKKVGKRQNGAMWKMHFREPSILRSWLLDMGFRSVIISLDVWGMYEYCTGRKTR